MTEKTKTIDIRGTGHAKEGRAHHTGPAAVDIEHMPVAEMRKKLEEALASLEESQKALEEKEREAAEYKDKYLRALAEAENQRKRIRQQAEESARIQREALLRDLLSIIDNLERAVAAARDGGNGKPIVEGVEMVSAFDGRLSAQPRSDSIKRGRSAIRSAAARGDRSRRKRRASAQYSGGRVCAWLSDRGAVIASGPGCGFQAAGPGGRIRRIRRIRFGFRRRAG